MTEDGPNIPRTPSPTKTAPAPDPFFDPARTVLERAAMLRKGRPIRARLALFQTLVAELSAPWAEASSAPSLPDLFGAAFGDPTGREFWRLRLQAFVAPSQFAEMLATFLSAEGGDKAMHKLAIGTLLAQDLTSAGVVPAVTEKAYAPIIGRLDPDEQHHAYVVQPTIRVEGDSFDPMVPLQWIAEREVFHEFIPASLLSFLQGTVEQGVKEKSSAPASIGRPVGTSLDIQDAPYVNRIVALVRAGEVSSVAAAAQTVVGDGAGIPGGGEARSKADRLRRKATKALKAGE